MNYQVKNKPFKPILSLILLFLSFSCGETVKNNLKSPQEKMIFLKSNQSPQVLQTNTNLLLSNQNYDSLLQSLTLKEKTAQLLIPYAAEYKDQYGGILFFEEQFRNKSFKKIRDKIVTNYRKIPAFFFVDQEGGVVDRFGKYYQVKFPSASEIGKMSHQNRFLEGQKTGKYMRESGMNALLGPVMDIGSPGTTMEKNKRSYGCTTEEVKSALLDYLKGFRSVNNSAILLGKHFPNYSAEVNSDICLANDTASYETIISNTKLFFDPELTHYLSGYLANNIWYQNFGNTFAVYNPNVRNMGLNYNPDFIMITDDLAAAASLYSEELVSYWNYKYLNSIPSKKLSKKMKVFLNKLKTRFTVPGATQRAEKLYLKEFTLVLQKAFDGGCDMFIITNEDLSVFAENVLSQYINTDPNRLKSLDERVNRILKLKRKMGLLDS